MSRGWLDAVSLRLLVATKARSSLFLGVLWRFNAWLTTMSGTRRELDPVRLRPGF